MKRLKDLDSLTDVQPLSHCDPRSADETYQLMPLVLFGRRHGAKTNFTPALADALADAEAGVEHGCPISAFCPETTTLKSYADGNALGFMESC